MYESACRNRPKRDESFFTCNTDKKKWHLTYAHYTKAIKKAAELAGFKDTKNFTAKSTRVGGASALAAANMPPYTIQEVGRWKSLAFMRYIRLSNKQFANAIKALTNRNTLTVADMRHTIPGMANL